MRATLKEIFEKYPDELFLTADGFDDAVIGLNDVSRRLIYNVHKCAELMMEGDGMERDEAYEFLEFNAIGAYYGEKTPIWVYDDGEEGFEEGQLCNRDECLGEIKEGCVDDLEYEDCDTIHQLCEVCGWKSNDE
jgi:hypothetical protein